MLHISTKVLVHKNAIIYGSLEQDEPMYGAFLTSIGNAVSEKMCSPLPCIKKYSITSSKQITDYGDVIEVTTEKYFR